MKVKAKFKWSFYRPGVAQSVGRGILYSSMTALLGGGKWSAARHSRTLPREKRGTHFTGGWVGSKAGLDGRNISSTPGLDPGTSSP